MNYKIEKITPKTAEKLCRNITAGLPEYFGLPECNEHYARGMISGLSFAAKVGNEYVGLLTLKFPYPKNADIYWMGIIREFQGQGIGSLLIDEAAKYAKMQGAKTMTVETLAPVESDKNYLKTYRFYEKEGFQPLFDLKPRGYEWAMVYMSKNLDTALQNLISLEKGARRFGFDWPNKEMIINQAVSECDEIKEAVLNGESSHRIQEEIGDLLHAAISLCFFSGYDIEQTLTKVTEKFGSRMDALNTLTKKRGLNDLKGQPIEFMLKLWKEAKQMQDNLIKPKNDG